MKRKATPERLPSRRAAAQAHIRRWETPRGALWAPVEDIRLKMVLNGWTDPQLVTVDDTVYVGALTGSTAIFITGEDGAYQSALAGNDLAVGVELYLPRIPSPGVICEIWRL